MMGSGRRSEMRRDGQLMDYHSAKVGTSTFIQLEYFRIGCMHLAIRKMRPDNGLERFTVSTKK